MWGQNSGWPSKVALMIPMVFITFCIPLHLGVGWPWKRSITFETMLQDSVTSCSPPSLPFTLTSSEGKQLPLPVLLYTETQAATPAKTEETNTSVQQPLKVKCNSRIISQSTHTWMQPCRRPWARGPRETSLRCLSQWNCEMINAALSH